MCSSKCVLVSFDTTVSVQTRCRALGHLARIETWRDDISADMESCLREVCRQHLHQMRDGRFGAAIGEAGSQRAAETGDGRCDDYLGVLRDVALLVTGIEEVEESNCGIEDSGVVDVGGEREVIEFGLEHGFLELSDRRLAAVFTAFFEESCMFRARDSGVCEEKVDVALFLTNLVGYFGQRLFVRYVADDVFDSAIDSSFGSFLESLFTASDDVDCFCAIHIKCSRCVKTQSRPPASYHGDEAFDVEEIGGFVVGRHPRGVSIRKYWLFLSCLLGIVPLMQRVGSIVDAHVLCDVNGEWRHSDQKGRRWTKHLPIQRIDACTCAAALQSSPTVFRFQRFCNDHGVTIEMEKPSKDGPWSTLISRSVITYA